MRALTKIAELANWVPRYAASWMAWLIFLRPNSSDFALVLVTDVIAFFITIPWSRSLARSLNPVATPNMSFRQPETAACALVNLETHQALDALHALSLLPSRQALLSMLGHAVCMLPGCFVALIHWSLPADFWTRCFIVIAVTALATIYAGAVTFFTTRASVARVVRFVHARKDWTDIIEARLWPGDERAAWFYGHIASCLVWALIISAQALMVLASRSRPELLSWINLASSGLLGLGLTLRMSYLARDHQDNGLAATIRKVNDAALARRLVEGQSELARWVAVAADNSGHKIVGEMAALIAHELSNPIHFVQFFAEEALENPRLATDASYLQRLSCNATRLRDLVGAIRGCVKDCRNSDNALQTFGDSHIHVLRLLKMKFDDERFNRVVFALDPKAEQAVAAVKGADLSHILSGLYASAAENLIRSNVTAPRVSIKYIETTGRNHKIAISNNGGEPGREFMESTSLMQRLASHYGGELKLADPPVAGGPTVIIEVPKAMGVH